MSEGVVQQYAPPLTVYDRPSNLFVADFVGNPTMNLIAGKAKRTEKGLAAVEIFGKEFKFTSSDDFDVPSSDVVVGIRPEFLPISEDGKVEGTIYSTLPAGMETTIKLNIGNEIISSVVFGSIDFKVDSKVKFDISGSKILLFDRKSGKNIASGSMNI